MHGDGVTVCGARRGAVLDVVCDFDFETRFREGEGEEGEEEGEGETHCELDDGMGTRLRLLRARG